MHHLIFAAVCVTWGASFILMKKAGLCFGAMSIGSYRLLGGAAALAALWAWRRPSRDLGRRDLPALAIMVLLGQVWPFALQPYLITKYHDSGFVGAIVALVPLFTVGVSIPLLRTYPTPRQIIGVLGGLAATALLVSEGLRRRMSALDLALAVSVPLAYSINNTVIKRQFSGRSMLLLSLTVSTAAGLLLLPAGLALEPVRQPAGLPLALASLAVLGVAGTGLANFLYYRLIRDHGPLYASMAGYLIPLGALLWAGIDREGLTVQQVAAVAGILAMVAVVQWRPTRGVRVADQA